MKKVLALLLALALVFGLAACTQTTPTNAPTTPAPGPTTAPTNAPDKPTEPQSTEEPLPWYVWDKEHPERYGGTCRFTYGDVISPSWDSLGETSWTTYMWAQPVYQAPLVLGDDGIVYPNLCTWERSEDGKIVTITIKEGQKFSDGTDVTVDDLLASIKRWQAFGKSKAAFWDILDHYEVDRDKRSVTFEFTQFDDASLKCLAERSASNWAVWKKDFCEKYPDIDHLNYDIKDVIGSGPYKIDVDETEEGSRVVFYRNEYYQPNLDNPEEGTGIATPCYQYYDKLEYIYISGGETQFMAMINDELDCTSSTNIANFRTMLEPTGQFKFETYISSGTYYMYFNCTHPGSPIQDPNVRKAIAACFDYDEMSYAQFGELATPHDSILVEGAYPDYKWPRERLDWYNANSVDLAKQYLAKSSYKGEHLTFAVFQPSFNVAEENLKAAGLNFDIVRLDNATLRAYSYDYSADWDLIYRPNPLAKTPAGWNYTFIDPWCNERAKELLSLLRGIPYSTEQSYAYWDELMDLYVEECPWVVLMTQVHGCVCHKDMHTRRNCDDYWYFMGYWDNPEDHVR